MRAEPMPQAIMGLPGPPQVDALRRAESTPYVDAGRAAAVPGAAHRARLGQRLDLRAHDGEVVGGGASYRPGALDGG